MIKALISGIILWAILLMALVWGGLHLYDNQTAQQVQEYTLETRLVRIQTTLDSIRPPVSDRCVAVMVLYPENGVLYKLGESKVCTTKSGMIIEDVIWPNGIEP